jgi:hypothetical protein
MDCNFRIPGREPVLVRGWGNIQIELIAAMAGVKPVLHCWIDPVDLPYLSNLAEALSLNHLVYNHAGPGTQKLGVMVGKRHADLKEMAAIWDADRTNPGPQLGYPLCCSRFYCDTYYNTQQADPPLDCIHHAAKNTPMGSGFSFLLNDVFYFYSRKGHPEDPARREAIGKKNRGLNLDIMNVIPWHPCSYRCPESLAKGRAIWATMLQVLPEHALVLRAYLARPIVFWDWMRFAVLKGARNGDGRWLYEGMQPPYSLLEPEIEERLRRGDRLESSADGRLEVFKGRRRLGPLPGNPAPLLLDFDSARDGLART